MRIQSQHLKPVNPIFKIFINTFLLHFSPSNSLNFPPMARIAISLHPPSRPRVSEEDEEVDNHIIKRKRPRRYGKDIVVSADDPPPETSKEASKRRRVSVQDFQELNRAEGDEILDNLLNDLSTKQEMALKVMLSLVEENYVESYGFWRAYYRSIHYRFLQLFDSPNLNIQALTFEVSVKLIYLLHQWGSFEEVDCLLLRMIQLLRAFHKDGQIDIMEPRMMDLADLARSYTVHFLKPLEVLLGCMFEIAATSDDNAFIKCQAIQIINILNKQAMVPVKEFLRQRLSNEAKWGILENCVRLMFCLEDVPAWYDMDRASSEKMGMSGSYDLGQSLLFLVCRNLEKYVLLSFGMEMMPQYLNSQDWRTRHAGLIAFAAILNSMDSVLAREQAERVLDISLADPHPRVRWAAIEVIRRSTEEIDGEQVQHLSKFLPKLATIIKSSASIYPRIQFLAAVAVRHLIKNCHHEDVKASSDDLVPELLKFLKLGKKFWEEATETLRSIASSFPVVFRKYYQETVDSLKPLLSQSLPGAKSIECLSYIFSGFLEDQSLSLCLSRDAMEVFIILIRFLDDWKSTDARVKIHILKALTQLCKLPQLEAGRFLEKMMPVLIQNLENNTNPTMPTMTLTINKQITTCSELICLACDSLSKFAVRFQEEFAPWASRASRLLTNLFKSTDSDDAKIASVKALPSVLHTCQHRKDSERTLFNSTVQALVEALQGETERANGIVMFESLNECIAISGSVLSEDVMKQIGLLLDQVLSQEPFDVVTQKLDQEEEIIRAAKCLETTIYTLKSAFVTHVKELLPAVEALWDPEREYPDKVKAAAISVLNLLLKDYPDTLGRHGDAYPPVLMEFCFSASPQLQLEGARGIGLCATHRDLIPYFDAPEAIDSLHHVMLCGMESESPDKTYDAAVSALGKICEFRRDAINGPQVVPIWLNHLPLRNDPQEARYAHRQLCQMLERFDQDLLGLNNENIDTITEILKEILLEGNNIATEETTCLIISLLSQLGAMS